jgi:hypothetical protein
VVEVDGEVKNEAPPRTRFAIPEGVSAGAVALNDALRVRRWPAARCALSVLAAALGLTAACASDSHDRAAPDGGAVGDASDAAPHAQHDAGQTESAPAYASEVVSFEPGGNAGFGQDQLPDVVLGPPMGKGTSRGSLDVLSLGVGGEIVLGFGELSIIDRDGVDLVVFENAFWPGNDKSAVYADLGEIAVSEDGKSWHTFECDPEGDGKGAYPGCAGWSPTLAFDPSSLDQLDVEQTGGDAFDLADLHVERARFVRIRDLAMQGEGTSAGFDLDAIGVVHAERSE